MNLLDIKIELFGNFYGELFDYVACLFPEGNVGEMAFGVGATKVGAAIGTAIPIPGVWDSSRAVAGFAVGYLGSKLYTAVTDGWKFGKKKQTLSEVVSGGIDNVID